MRKFGDDIFEKMFNRDSMRWYAEGATGETPVEVTATDVPVDGDAVVVAPVDGDGVVAVPTEAPSVEMEIPTTGDNVEKVEVNIEYAEAVRRANKYCEDASGMIDALEAGASAVVEDGSVKIGAVETLPESENTTDGIVGLGDMNSDRIIPEVTAKDDDGSFED